MRNRNTQTTNRGRMPRTLFWILGGLLGIAAVSCYRPTYEGPYLCDPTNKGSDCPDGWSCSAGQCLAPGQTPPQSGICAGAGTLLGMARGDQIWACSGSFAAGGAGTLCADLPDVHPCGAGPHDESLVSLVDCDTVKGFFLSQVSLSPGPFPICDPGPGLPRVLLGCGTAPGVIKIPGPDCHGLHHALGCSDASGWSCDLQKGSSSAAHTESASNPGGVLCCSGGMVPRR